MLVSETISLCRLRSARADYCRGWTHPPGPPSITFRRLQKVAWQTLSWSSKLALLASWLFRLEGA